MLIDVSFNASDGVCTFQHGIGASILDTDDAFNAGWNKASEWCERNGCYLESVDFVNTFDDSGKSFLGTVTAPL